MWSLLGFFQPLQKEQVVTLGFAALLPPPPPPKKARESLRPHLPRHTDRTKEALATNSSWSDQPQTQSQKGAYKEPPDVQLQN